MTHRQRTAVGLALAVFVALAAAAAWYAIWPRYQRFRAERAVASGDFGRAEALLRQLTAEQPDDPSAQLLFAHVLRRLGRTADARTAIARAVRLGAAETEARRELALVEAGAHFRAVENALWAAHRERPDDPEVLQALAEGYLRGRRWARAEDAFTRWLEVEPERVETQMGRGRAREENRRFEKAADDYRAVLRRSPEHYGARLHLAQCLLANARIPEAEEELLRCHRLQPQRAEPLIGLAGCALERKDWDRADSYLVQALVREPDSVLALSQQADLCLVRGDYARAVPVLNRLARLNPRDAAVHLKLSQVLRHQGDAEGARIHAQRYRELAGTAEPGLPPSTAGK